jgi:protein gp37
MENSNISWCHDSFNPWYGCARVSEACRNCYAADLALTKGLLEDWGPGTVRKRTSEEYWRKPLRWNNEARRSGNRRRVFCASLADVFDAEVPTQWRADLFELIRKTPNLDWLLLTKRPQLIEEQLREISVWDSLPWRQIWFGTTMEDQRCFDERWPHLGRIPTPVRFVSYEPAMGPLILPESVQGELDWLIAGGETTMRKNQSRPSDPAWFRSVRDQCEHLGVSFHFKQWGNDLSMPDGSRRWVGKTARLYRETHHLLEGQVHQNFPVPRLLGEADEGRIPSAPISVDPILPRQ